MTSTSDIRLITPASPDYPHRLASGWVGSPSPELRTRGNIALLDLPLVASFCSVKCPGNLILQSHDLARRLREHHIPVVGGFHSPIEKEVLTVLLRGQSPLITCPARSIGKMRIPAEQKAPLTEDRLLIVSPFKDYQKRASKTTARYRNRVVAGLAEWVFIAYTDEGGSTESLAREIITQGKPVYTFDSTYTANLIRLGAQTVRLDEDSLAWEVG